MNVDTFVKAALEASIVASPSEPGLTIEQLVLVGRAFSLKKGELMDAAKLACRSGDAELVAGRYRLTSRGGAQLNVFHLRPADDLRDPDAFEEVHLFFCELAREVGIDNTVATEDSVLSRPIATGRISAEDARAAIAMFLLAGNLTREKDGRLRLTPGFQRWVVPSEQLKASSVFQRDIPSMQEILRQTRAALLNAPYDEAAASSAGDSTLHRPSDDDPSTRSSSSPLDDAQIARLARLRAAVESVEQKDATRRERVLALSQSLGEECRRANVACRTKSFVLDSAGGEQTYGYVHLSERGLSLAIRSRQEDMEDVLNNVPQAHWTYTSIEPKNWTVSIHRAVEENGKLEEIMDALLAELHEVGVDRRPSAKPSESGVASSETADGSQPAVKTTVKSETHIALSRILGFLLESTQGNPFHWSKAPQHAAPLHEQDTRLREITSALSARTYKLTPLQKKYVVEAAHEALASLQSLGGTAFQLSPRHGLLWQGITKSAALLARLFPYTPSERTNAPVLIRVGEDGFSLHFSELMEQLRQFDELPTSTDATETTHPHTKRHAEMTIEKNPDREEGQEFPAMVVFVILKGLKEPPDGPTVPRALSALHAALSSLNSNVYVLSTIAGAIIVVPDDVTFRLEDVLAVLRTVSAGFPLRVGVTHGPVEVVVDIDQERNLIGPSINFAARVATSPENSGVLVEESFANHAASTLPASHWLHPSKRREMMIAGKPQDPPFRCFPGPDSFEKKPLAFEAEPHWRNAVFISYDLPKFSGGDRSELRKRFTRLGHAFKKVWPTLPMKPWVSPGGDGGVMVLPGLSLTQAADVATKLRNVSETESIGHDGALAVKVRIGVHYGAIGEYANARGIVRPAGMELFVADEIASDVHARARDEVVVTRHVADSVAVGSVERLAELFEQLPALPTGPGAGVDRFVRRGAASKTTAPVHDSATPSLASNNDAPPTEAQWFEPLTTIMTSPADPGKKRTVAPALWKLTASPKPARMRTRAELNKAINDAIVLADGGTGRNTRLPAPLRPGVATEQVKAGSHVWLFLGQDMAGKERHEEQLGAKLDGSIWFQRAHFWDASEIWLDMGLCAHDTIVFLKLVIGVGSTLGVSSYDVTLAVETPRADVIVNLNTNGFAAKQPGRTARATVTRQSTTVSVGPMTSTSNAAQAVLAKQLIDGVVNEFGLAADPFFRGSGPPFLEIDERSIAAVLQQFK